MTLLLNRHWEMLLMTLKRSSIFLWLMVALALAPAMLFAYLGQFSRAMHDDFCQFYLGLEHGPWGFVMYEFYKWTGSYSNWFLKGMTAQLFTVAPRIAPGLIVISWLVCLSWLIFQGLTRLRMNDSRWPLAVALAALAVAAAINAFYSPQSFYWYAASTRYTLPLALLAIYLALVFWTGQRTRSRRSLLLSLIAGGLLCFIMAGASEMFAVFQLAFLTFCLLAVFAFSQPSARYCYARIFGAGWLVTLAGFLIQLSAPGTAARAAAIEERLGQLNRTLLALMPKTFSLTFDHLEHPPVFAGFALLLGAGLLVMLFKYQPPALSKTSRAVGPVWPALWLSLAFQLLWLPVLWGHTSEYPQFFGRFSARYMAVISLNMAFILAFLALLWQRKRIQAHLQKQERSTLVVYSIIAFASVFISLFLLTQINRSIERISISYLLTSLLALSALLTWQLLPCAVTRKFGLLALYSSAMGLGCLVLMIGASSYSVGYIVPRSLAPIAWLLTFSGLVWGFFFGFLLKHYPPGQIWVRLLKLVSLGMALIIGINMTLGQAALIPDFRRFAREWDELHLDIIARRDSGQKTIEIAPLSYDLADYIDVETLGNIASDCERYYGVDLIAVDG